MPLMPGAMRKRSLEWRRCVQEVAVEQVLAVLLQAERVVDLGARLARHQRAQELHVGAGDFHVDHEVGAREAEQDQQLVLVEHRGVDGQLAALGVQDGQRERHLGVAVDDLAHQVGALVAVEQRGQHLDLEIGAQRPVDHRQADVRAQRGQHMVDVAVQVLELALQLEVVDDAQQGLAHRFARRVVGAVGGPRAGLVVLDVLGAHRRAHEDEVVAEVAAVQQLDGDRIEEGLGQLGLVVVDEQADVVQLDLLPAVHRQRGDVELALQPHRRLLHALVVELDAQRLRTLLAMPVGGLEARLGRGAGLAEQPVVAVEAVEHRARDVEGPGVGQAVRKHRGAFLAAARAARALVRLGRSSTRQMVADAWPMPRKAN